mmetsp:Transcript_4621/g.12388  ORF Transcript_4621/g.12388 Transcript_4621/m.12388 type:complete len:220 (+) Transcript_4621:46-705(+)
MARKPLPRRRPAGRPSAPRGRRPTRRRKQWLPSDAIACRRRLGCRAAHHGQEGLLGGRQAPLRDQLLQRPATLGERGHLRLRHRVARREPPERLGELRAVPERLHARLGPDVEDAIQRLEVPRRHEEVQLGAPPGEQLRLGHRQLRARLRAAENLPHLGGLHGLHPSFGPPVRDVGRVRGWQRLAQPPGGVQDARLVPGPPAPLHLGGQAAVLHLEHDA